MRLKIDKIQEVIDNIDYAEKPREQLFSKNEDGIYTWIGCRNEEWLYKAQKIVDNIILYYLNNVLDKTLVEFFDFQPYDDIADGTWGLFRHTIL